MRSGPMRLTKVDSVRATLMSLDVKASYSSPSSRQPAACTLSLSSQCWGWRHNKCQSPWWPDWTTPSSFSCDPVKNILKARLVTRRNTLLSRQEKIISAICKAVSYLPWAWKKHVGIGRWRKARQSWAPEQAEHTRIWRLKLVLE